MAWTHICAAYKFSVYLVWFLRNAYFKIWQLFILPSRRLNRPECQMHHFIFRQIHGQIIDEKKTEAKFLWKTQTCRSVSMIFFFAFSSFHHTVWWNWGTFSRNSIELVNKHPLVYSSLKNKTILELSNKQKNSTSPNARRNEIENTCSTFHICCVVFAIVQHLECADKNRECAQYCTALKWNSTALWQRTDRDRNRAGKSSPSTM